LIRRHGPEGLAFTRELAARTVAQLLLPGGGGFPFRGVEGAVLSEVVGAVLAVELGVGKAVVEGLANADEVAEDAGEELHRLLEAEPGAVCERKALAILPKPRLRANARLVPLLACQCFRLAACHNFRLGRLREALPARCHDRIDEHRERLLVGDLGRS
jgi:hypothetical protein